MKVLFYSPYIPEHFGGGEKHLFDVASTVATRHEVYIAIPKQLVESVETLEQIKKSYEAFLNYSLEAVTFVPSVLKTGPVLEKLSETKQYDYLYYATDGSFFFSAARKNNLHIQIPFTNKLSFFEKMKLGSWQIKNTNSNFTKEVIENSWQTKVSYVHHPLVSLDEIQPGKNKENIILHVGRFFKQLHSKRQDVLVVLFRALIEQHKDALKNWKLVLVGKVEDTAYLDEVISLAKGYPIEIKIDVSRSELIELYKKAKIYWHATGYKVDEVTHPEMVEHFGISTIEAMAGGCVPVVINKGGQKEILGEGLTELLWNTEEECLAKTLSLIDSSTTYAELQKKSLEAVEKFSKPHFESVLWEMFK